MNVTKHLLELYENHSAFPEGILGERNNQPSAFIGGAIFEKYSSTDRAFKAVNLNRKSGVVQRATFVLASDDLLMSDLVECLGIPETRYSFRDDITRFAFKSENKLIDEILVDCDGKVEFDDMSLLSAVTIVHPRG